MGGAPRRREWTKACRFSSSASSWLPALCVALAARAHRASRSRRVPRRSGCCSARTGPAGSTFDDAELAREVGIDRARPDPLRGRAADVVATPARVAVPAALLSTVGVVVTAVLIGRRRAGALRPLLARVDPARRRRRLDRRGGGVRDAPLHAHPRRLARTLEAESGGNDPMAIALTLGLIAWIERPDTYGHRRPRAARRPQLGLGLLVGVALGLAAMLGLRAAPRVDRAVRAGGVARRRRALVRRRGRDRRERIPRRLPRRPRRREHAVALPAAARRLPRGRRVPRAGRALHRPRAARLPEPAAGRRARRAWRSRSLLVLLDPARRGVGVDGVQRLHRARARSCSAGPACAGRSRSCSPRSCSPPR